MKKTTVFDLSQQDILDLISGAIGHPVTLENVKWNIKESGDADRGSYRQTVTALTVIIDQHVFNATTKIKQCIYTKKEFEEGQGFPKKSKNPTFADAFIDQKAYIGYKNTNKILGSKKNQKAIEMIFQSSKSDDSTISTMLIKPKPRQESPVDVSEDGEMTCKLCKNPVERLSKNSCKCTTCGYSLNFHIVNK